MLNQSYQSYYFLIIFIVLLVFMAPRFSDKLPHCMLKLFLNPYFKVLVVFLAIYSIKFNIFLSISIALIYLLVINRLENNVLFELFLSENTNIDHFDNYNQVLDPQQYTSENKDDDDEDDGDDDGTDPNSAYYGSKEMLTCLNTVNDYFPCNNRKKDRSCCESINYDIKIKNNKGNTENITLFMNKQLENKNMTGIKNIHHWCKNYVASKDPSSGLKYGCSDKSLTSKCEKILSKCQFIKPKSTPKKQYDFSGTCAAVDENIHNQVCFDLDPKQDKCKSLNKDQCIKNKNDCFYIENNQFINSKLRKNNSIYKCKIPKAEEPLPQNCFPIKLYKDTCGNVGMGCWVKDRDIPVVEAEVLPTPADKAKVKMGKTYPGIVMKKLPTVNYRTPNQNGFITNRKCI